MPAPYATPDDLAIRFGQGEIDALVANSAPGAAERALSDATEECESYISVLYTPPYPNLPRPLVSAACDIARFRLYKDRATEEVKYRYEQALKWLLLVSKGQAKLTFDPPLGVEDPVVVVTDPAPAVGRASGGVFSDALFEHQPSTYIWGR